MQEKCAGVCHIVGAGDLTISRVKTAEGDLVMAVDGGLSYCSILELEPDIIIGDFDSVSQGEREAIEELKRKVPEKIIELPPEKDDTDMLAALKLGLEKGYRSFRIYAGTGGRLEHTLANIQCLLYLKNHEAVGYIMDGNSMIFVMQNEEVRFKADMSGLLSLFSLGKTARGVTIEGLKYPLTNYTVTNDFPIGISNEFAGTEGLVRVEDGELVCVISYME